MPKGIYERSLETRIKISESAKKRFKNKKNHPRYGKHLSNETKEKIRLAHLGKHHTKESKEKDRLANLGENNGMYGKHHTKKALEKMSKTFFKKGNSGWNKDIPRSKEVRIKISNSLKGENNFNWKGGITPLNFQIRGSFEYRQWRSDVFTRDNFTCQDCEQRGVYLHAHHKKSFSSILQYYEITTLEEALNCEELWNINNGITLCKDCHKKIHKNKLIKPFQPSLAK